jgi:wyosine [tRNA(Phe)-imidazoG37] synthetase (radical SAM superfamily)
MPAFKTLLKVEDHSRDSVAMTYVYPVVSRRAEGVSIGINLNPNNACNWRCIYCQVPDLRRGGPPPINLDVLRQELQALIAEVLHGGFMESRVPAAARQLMDIAFSGNGEPTSAPEFPDAVALVADVVEQQGLKGRLAIRLITNGSLLERSSVRAGVALLGKAGGEVWFKVDGATAAALARINNTRTTPASVLRRLRLCASLCTTWVQTCLFRLDGNPPSEEEICAYIDLVSGARDLIAGIHLYGLARASQQPEASRLAPISAQELEAVATRLRARGLTVKVSP